MLKIPATYYNNNEDYITLPAIYDFMRRHPDGNFKMSMAREALLNSIVEYANGSKERENSVLDWLDMVLQEGIRDIYLQYAPIPEALALLFANAQNIAAYLNQYLNLNYNKHICMNTYGPNYILVNAVYSQDAHGRRITFSYCRKLYTHDKTKHLTRPIDYPVIADYFIDTHWLLVRAKPRSNLYLFTENGFNLEQAENTTTEKEIRIVSSLVRGILQFQKVEQAVVCAQVKGKLFNLLHTYSATPAVIADLMEARKQDIADISRRILALCSVEGQCSIPQSMVADIDDDILNTVEKYLSINWQDKNVFMMDREAYPVKLAATDEEESKVEQSAAINEPLQTKALFFDNKKMLYKSRQCDGVTFRWKRENPENALRDTFGVRIQVKPKGDCIFKFPEYTSKEDIENVVFSVIGNQAPVEQ